VRFSTPKVAKDGFMSAGRVLVGFSEGSASNLVARVLVPELGIALGQALDIERVPGDNGLLSLRHAAGAQPDGATLVIVIQTHIIGALLKGEEGAPLQGLAPIAMLAKWPMVIAVGCDSEITSVADLVARARNRNGVLTYGASAVGGAPHLAAVLFAAMTGIDLRLRVYAETDVLYADLAAGDIALTFNNTMSVLPLARAGRLRMLGSCGAQRMAAAPDVPAVAETVAGYEVVNWVGLAGPAGLDAGTVSRINTAANAATASGDVASWLDASGMERIAATPAAFAAHLATEVRRWGPVVRAAGITVPG